VLVDLISLIGAFAAGSCRKLSTFVYAILVVVAVLTALRLLLGGKIHPPIVGTAVVSKRTEHKWRKDLMLIGTLAITVTYQARLLPPGGAWPDNHDGHFAGDPILHDTNRTRYRVFFYCNATTFMASMVMVTLLLNNTISKYKRSLLAMKTAMVLNLLGLLGAYAVGSCRKFKTSAYIFALVIAVLIYIVIHVLLSFDKVARLVKEKGQNCIPFLKKSAPLRMDPNNQPFVGEPGQVPLHV
jgi:uncharacterized membrane protein YfcA